MKKQRRILNAGILVKTHIKSGECTPLGDSCLRCCDGDECMDVCLPENYYNT